MADISKIRLENETYDIKDATARNDISSINTILNRKLNKKYLLVGDSYGEGYSADGYVESWCTKFKNYLGLNITHVHEAVGCPECSALGLPVPAGSAGARSGTGINTFG